MDDDTTLDLPAVPPSATRKNARGLRTRDRMITAAQHCFGELGYARTRISDIVTRAKVSQGNFYRHFESKDEIFLAALRPSLEELAATTRAELEPEADVHELAALMTSYLTVYRRHRQLLKVMREAAALGEPDGFVEAWLTERSKFVRRLQRWLLQGGPAPDDRVRHRAQQHAEAIGAMIEQVAYVHFGLTVAEPDDDAIEGWSVVLASVMVQAKAAMPR